MQTPIRHLAPLLPHAGNMILLDEICHYSDSQLQALARIGPNHLFLDETGQLPLWCAVEIMAQAIAALAGCHAHDAGQPVKPGFLLGSRQIDLRRPAVAQGSLLRVDVSASTRDEASGFGVFDCSLSLLNALEAAPVSTTSTTFSNPTLANIDCAQSNCADPEFTDTRQAETLVTARLSVFSPPDIEQYLQEQTA